MLIEDRRAQFLMAVVDGCLGAALAGLEVDVGIDNGAMVSGRPSAPLPADEIEGLDDIGYCRIVQIGGRDVDLRAVVSITIHAPADS